MVAYSFKKRFADPIRVGLGLVKMCPPSDLPRAKTQTIRAIGKRRHARPGETIQIYVGMRSIDCEKLGDARCKSVDPVTLFIGPRPGFLGVNIAGEYFCSPRRTLEFAQADGFDSVEAMIAFWDTEHPAITEFHGLLIRWEPLA
jgi:hypothetical protein